MSLRIRPAALTDIPAITRIYNQGVATRMATADTEFKSEADRAEWFSHFDESFPIWVGEDPADGQVQCYGNLHRWSPRLGYRFTAENSVYVAEAARGRGYGGQMLAHVVSEARRLGLHYLLARIFSENEASLRLHRTQGFSVLGIQREVIHLDGRWRDVTLMDLKLGPG